MPIHSNAVKKGIFIMTIFWVMTSAMGFAAVPADSAVSFDTYFLDKTMRLDYFHSGNASAEHVAIDQIVSDGPWPGSKSQLLDTLKLGSYWFEVFSSADNHLIFSSGFASVYGEWVTTAEAEKEWGTFHESLRFPWPKAPVKVILYKRDKQNQWQQVWTTMIDPAARTVNPADMVHTEKVFTVFENGPAEKKVDLLVLGDGYTEAEMPKFRSDVQRIIDALFSAEPYASRKKDFNVRAVETPSPVSGVCRPHPGVFKRTPLSVHYGSFDSERYALTYDNRRIRDISSAVPYDFTIILVNERTYGGGGIYKLYITMAADNAFYKYLVIHELGHHLAALADEYYTSQVSYEMDEKITTEPWETNITALLDKDHLKWKNLVTTGTPIPTPWPQAEFDPHSYGVQKERQRLRSSAAPEEQMEALFRKQQEEEDKILAKSPFHGKVGAFEGAGYMPKGLFRSSTNCIMFTRTLTFCPVCQHAIEAVIDFYTK